MSTTQAILPTHKSDPDEIEIRLSDVVKFLKDSRRTVLLCMTIFLLLGVLYAVSKANEYVSTVRVMPELKSPAGASGLGDLKSLAGLAGVSLDNLSGTSEAIRPDLYPDIVQSVPFTLYLLSQPVTTNETKKPQPLQRFLIEQSNRGLSGWVGRLAGDSDEDVQPAPTAAALQLTKQQEELSRMIGQRVGAAIDKKSGIVTITAKMPDPVVAAITARQTLDYLTNYVTNYRTGKSRKQVQFLGQQVSNARRRYGASEYALSSYRDRNRSLFLNTAKIEEQRLQADYLLAQTVYNDLSKQLEQARIKVQEEAPVFQLLEPPTIPLRKSEPGRTLIVVGFSILGAILGVIVFFARRFVNSNRS
ncbi:GNVR domain-containing protein [Spirosoma arcticum]